MIEGTAPTPDAPTASTQSGSLTGIGGLGSDAFLRLLVAQLRYQNPMDPADGTQMLQQTAQFTTVETLQSLAETQERLAGFQQVTLALSVVGEEVFAVDGAGQPVAGTVDGLRFTADGPLLQISGTEVPLANVLSVATPPVLPELPAPEPAGAAAPDPAEAAPPPDPTEPATAPAATSAEQPAATSAEQPAATSAA